MRQAILTRTETGPEGTFGYLITDQNFYCITGELPWRENATGKSCILPGPDQGPRTYRCNKRWSEKHKGPVYHVDGVEGRTEIQIHSANLVGNEDEGLVAQVLGCIAPGKSIVTFMAGTKPAGSKNQRGISSSRDALAALEKDLGGEDFMLTVRWIGRT